MFGLISMARNNVARRLLIASLMAALFCPVAARAWEPWSYIAEPIEGRVVDKETGQPIEGAVVVAQWILAKPLEGHSVDHWVVIEAITDTEGRYHIPGWGPKTRPWNRWLSNYDPKLVVFKLGYWPKKLINQDPSHFR